MVIKNIKNIQQYIANIMQHQYETDTVDGNTESKEDEKQSMDQSLKPTNLVPDAFDIENKSKRTRKNIMMIQ